jgi:CDP-diacylglycerol--glycerol-3-phosphate 3-phosphatidyltransferase
MNRTQEKDTKTLTEFLRRIFKQVLDGIAAFLNRLGIKPNLITFAGLAGSLAAAILIASGRLFWGGLVALIVGPLDALDGVLARLRDESCEYGAFIDSVIDRYSEMVIYGGLLVFFAVDGDWLDMLVVFIAAIGSFMVSYTRARGEALGYQTKIGLLTRAERYIVLVPGILLGYPRVSIWIVAVLANFTALQRILTIRKRMLKSNEVIRREKD